MPTNPLSNSASPFEGDELGITMRDYFAAQALNALLLAPSREKEDQGPARYAEIAYAFADAMLAARGSGLI